MSEHAWSLVDAAGKGDAAAFGALYREYVDSVYRYALGRTRDPVFAEDITSETFLRALRSLGSLSHRRSTFRAWLFTIARNMIADERRAGRSREVPVAELFGADTDADHDADPLWIVCRGDLQREVRRLLDVLTPDQRDCVELRFLHHLPLPEVAARMNRGPRAAAAVQSRAIRTLRTTLQGC